MWEYSEKVLEHYRHPRNVGKIDNADLIGEAGSLACGDSLKLYIKLDGSVIKDAKFQTFGCGSLFCYGTGSAGRCTQKVLR